MVNRLNGYGITKIKALAKFQAQLSWHEQVTLTAPEAQQDALWSQATCHVVVA